MENWFRVKKLLFSSIIALTMMGASCENDGGQPSSPSQNPSSSKSTHPIHIDNEVKSKPASMQKVDEPMPDSLDTESETAPDHKTPESDKLDSIKNSYPSKKR